MTHPTKRRTYSKAQWDEAQQAWARFLSDASAEMRSEWREWRHMAAMEAGIIVPPQGGRFDSWADDNPSELAILTRAIRETPGLLRSALRSPKVHSWAAVVALIVRGRDERADHAERTVERDERELRELTPTPRQATYALSEILRIIGDSR